MVAGTLGENGVHGLHDRDAFVERHQRAFEKSVPQAACDLVGFVPQAPATVRLGETRRGPVAGLSAKEVGV